ncbi:MAG TPA: GntR family transcriptional regulator [Jiangellaceae bacterium]
MSIDRLDPRSPSRQIADDLRTAIESGEIPAGGKLPSERELVEKYGIAPQTARQAVALLKTEGLVDGQPGRGVFVRERPPMIRIGSDRYSRSRRDKGLAPFQAEAEERGLTWSQEVLELAEVPAPAWVAEWFSIDAGTTVFVRRRRTWLDGKPTQLADSYYELATVEGTRIREEDTGPGGGYARLEEKGLHLARFREEIALRMPSPDEARSLKLSPGVPVAELHRIAFVEVRRPIEVFRSVMAGDMHVFAYEFEAAE